jgi:hypothetical protein
MVDQSGFEARAVIAPRRRRLARASLLLPVVALVAIVLVGASGARPDHPTAVVPVPIIAASPAPPSEPPFPGEVLGFGVQRLDAVQIQDLGLDTVVAVAGWYTPMLVADCPPLAARYIPGPFPNVRGDVDPYAFCARSGVFYVPRPDPDAPVVMDIIDGVGYRRAGLETIGASMVEGVVAPREMETVGGGATQVVVLGRFVYSENACGTAAACRALLIDYVGWWPGA